MQGPFTQVSNRADWYGGLQVTDAIDSALVDLSGATATLKIRDDTGAETLLASTDAGTITFPEIGYAAFLASKAVMSGIDPGVYDIGFSFTRDGFTLQMFMSDLSITAGL